MEKRRDEWCKPFWKRCNSYLRCLLHRCGAKNNTRSCWSALRWRGEEPRFCWSWKCRNYWYRALSTWNGKQFFRAICLHKKKPRLVLSLCYFIQFHQIKSLKRDRIDCTDKWRKEPKFGWGITKEICIILRGKVTKLSWKKVRWKT